MSKVIISGGRDFADYRLLKDRCDFYLQNIVDIEIVSGTCRGADKLGERYASQKGFEVIPYPADWERYGKAAGTIRNQEMADVADFLIAFWDGSSRGTNDMIKKAIKKGLKVKVVNY